MNLQKLVRPNIYFLKPYSCARNEFKGEASVYLDANENPMNAPYNRYPDPLQWELKKKIARVQKDEKHVQLNQQNHVIQRALARRISMSALDDVRTHPLP